MLRFFLDVESYAAPHGRMDLYSILGVSKKEVQTQQQLLTAYGKALREIAADAAEVHDVTCPPIPDSEIESFVRCVLEGTETIPQTLTEDNSEQYSSAKPTPLPPPSTPTIASSSTLFHGLQHSRFIEFTRRVQDTFYAYSVLSDTNELRAVYDQCGISGIEFLSATNTLTDDYFFSPFVGLLMHGRFSVAVIASIRAVFIFLLTVFLGLVVHRLESEFPTDYSEPSYLEDADAADSRRAWSAVFAPMILAGSIVLLLSLCAPIMLIYRAYRDNKDPYGVRYAKAEDSLWTVLQKTLTKRLNVVRMASPVFAAAFLFTLHGKLSGDIESWSSVGAAYWLLLITIAIPRAIQWIDTFAFSISVDDAEAIERRAKMVEAATGVTLIPWHQRQTRYEVLRSCVHSIIASASTSLDDDDEEETSWMTSTYSNLSAFQRLSNIVHILYALMDIFIPLFLSAFVISELNDWEASNADSSFASWALNQTANATLGNITTSTPQLLRVLNATFDVQPVTPRWDAVLTVVAVYLSGWFVVALMNHCWEESENVLILHERVREVLLQLYDAALSAEEGGDSQFASGTFAASAVFPGQPEPSESQFYPQKGSEPYGEEPYGEEEEPTSSAVWLDQIEKLHETTRNERLKAVGIVVLKAVLLYSCLLSFVLLLKEKAADHSSRSYANVFAPLFVVLAFSLIASIASASWAVSVKRRSTHHNPDEFGFPDTFDADGEGDAEIQEVNHRVVQVNKPSDSIKGARPTSIVQERPPLTAEEVEAQEAWMRRSIEASQPKVELPGYEVSSISGRSLHLDRKSIHAGQALERAAVARDTMYIDQLIAGMRDAAVVAKKPRRLKVTRTAGGDEN